MVVDGGHEEDAFASEFEAEYLEDDRKGFDDEDETDEQEQYLTFAEDGEVGDDAAYGEAAGVAHEEFGGVAVVPEEAQ